MCKIVEDLCNDAKIEEKKEIAIRLLKQSELSNENIAVYLGCLGIAWLGFKKIQATV